MHDSNFLRFQKLNFITFDTETEGLNLVYCRPWQLGYRLVKDNQTIKDVSKFIWWEDLNISERAAEMTHFNHNFYEENAEDAEVVYEELMGLIRDESNLIVGQNVYFDIAMLKSWARALNKKFDFNFNHRVIDLVALSKARKLEIKPPLDKKDYPAWQFKMLNYVKKGFKTNLELTAKELGVDFDSSKAHEALYDAQKTAEVFQQMLYKIDL